jgi:hypothetical protein
LLASVTKKKSFVGNLTTSTSKCIGAVPWLNTTRGCVLQKETKVAGTFFVLRLHAISEMLSGWLENETHRLFIEGMLWC